MKTVAEGEAEKEDWSRIDKEFQGHFFLGTCSLSIGNVLGHK